MKKRRLLLYLVGFLVVQQTCVYVRTEVIGHKDVPEVPAAFKVKQMREDDLAYRHLMDVGQKVMQKHRGPWSEWPAESLAEYRAVNGPIFDAVDWELLTPQMPNTGASRIPIITTMEDQLPSARPLFDVFYVGLVEAWIEGPSPRTALCLERSVQVSGLFWENATSLNYIMGTRADVDMASVILEQPPNTYWIRAARHLSERPLERAFGQAAYSEIPLAFDMYDKLYDQPDGYVTRWVNRVFGVYNRHLTKREAFDRFEHMAAAIEKPLDAYQSVSTRKLSLYETNYLGNSILRLTSPVYEPLMHKHGLACILRDAMRIWISLAEAEQPWNRESVSQLVQQDGLTNPFNGQRYTVDERGRLNVLPPEDTRWDGLIGKNSLFPSSRLVPHDVGSDR
ncbi:MAG: hypothetical protein KDC35_11360 [Acidobacteria bacterium]|nr:hypothetical protein [Acidobacteriota bacterium]